MHEMERLRWCAVLVASCWTAMLAGSAHVQGGWSDAGMERRSTSTGGYIGNEVISENTTTLVPPSHVPSCVYHESTKTTKPPVTLVSLLRVHNATYGRLQLNQTARPKATWRLICARDPVTRERGKPSVVLMKMNTTIGDYIQIKSKRLQGCTSHYRGFVFKKKSILIGYVPSPHTEGGELELGYICIKTSMQRLATSLFRRRPLEYIQNRNMFERVAGLLRAGEEGLLNITATDLELRHAIDLAQSAPRRVELDDSGSGENTQDYD